MENVYYDNLDGITALFIGDSLFGGHGIGKDATWINLLAKKYNMRFENHGSNGCTMSACEGGANPIINRYYDMPLWDADLVVFEGGRNDYNKNASLGTSDGGDITTYRGALAALISGLRARYPRATLAAVSFWRVGERPNDIGIPCGEYTAAMADVCRELDVNFIEACDEEASGVRMTDPTFRAEYCWVPGDVCHLNVRGMELALPFFEKELARIMSGK